MTRLTDEEYEKIQEDGPTIEQVTEDAINYEAAVVILSASDREETR
jgi:hypothetical protein